MAEALRRRSTRVRRIRRDPGYSYDSEFEEVVNRKLSRRVTWHSSLSEADSKCSLTVAETRGENSVSAAPVSWSDLNFYKLAYISVQDSSQQSGSVSPAHCDRSVRSRSQHQHRDTEIQAGADDAGQFINIGSGSDISGSGFRCNSSTRLDFLEHDTYLLNNSNSSVNSNMPNKDQETGCDCDACISGRPCEASQACGGPALPAAAPDSRDIMAAVLMAVQKIDDLSQKVNGMELNMARQETEIRRLKGNTNEEVCSVRPRSDLKGKSKESGDSKKDRVEEEKDRTFRVMQEKLNKYKTSRSPEREESSDEGRDMKAVRRKMSRSQRDQASSKMSSRLQQAGATFPEDDFDATSSSGMGSESTRRVCNHSRKVKSGASVKKRPVVKTELWPHTIANEDDGEEITSENISLAKFFSCFTFIMLDCGERESSGRSVLLHAISLVLECLFWTDARAFHNLVMVKLEQGRLDWADDFTALAENYIDKKVRLSLRAKSSAGTSMPNRSGQYSRGAGSGYSSRSFGKGFGSNTRRYAGRSRSLYSSICRQWNFGSCSYGERCNLWHVCWSCAEAGKLGETHRASSHEGAGARSRQGEQRR